MTGYEFDLDVIKYRQARGYNQCEIAKDGDIDMLILKVDELEKINEKLIERNENLIEDLEDCSNYEEDGCE